MVDQGPWLDVDLDALVANARRYAALVGVPLMPMIKADGYGLGAVPVAKALERLDPWGFGIAMAVEAARLRAAGITKPLVSFLPLVESAIDQYLDLDVRPAIGSPAELEGWLARAGDRPFHLTIDTGMGRSGIRWHDQGALTRVAELVKRAPGYEGIFTHFHSADISEHATAEQWGRFERCIAALGRRPSLVHAANSAAAQWGARFAGTLARPGIFLYGGRAGTLEPEPVARVSALVVSVRGIRAGDTVSYGATFTAPTDADVVTLGIGYADGVLRSLSSAGVVSLGGRSWPIAGRVTMDMVMVVTPIGTTRVGDRAIVFGGPVPIDDQAARAGTISYELLTSVGPRVVRRYRGGV